MITAFAPATVANLNCGFDVLGLAIDAPGDEVSVKFNDLGESRIVKIEGDEGKLPYDISKNTAGVAILSLCKHLNVARGIDISIRKKMPFGSGLGSSAASAVAAVVAANHLLDNSLKKRDLLDFSLDGEAIASGARHADNVAPCLLGGITLIRSYQPETDLIELPVPKKMYCSVIHPQVEILTQKARSILPEKVPMKAAIKQTGNLAGLIAGLYQEDLALVGRSMQDKLIEPYRSTLIPEFQRVKQAALYGGALAFGISGSGPSMFALSDSHIRAQQISTLMQKTLQNKKIDCTVYTSRVNTKGAVII